MYQRRTGTTGLRLLTAAWLALPLSSPAADESPFYRSVVDVGSFVVDAVHRRAPVS